MSKSQSQQILELLQERGDAGASNFELMQIAFQYPARIHTLRHKEGHNIESTHVKDKEWRIRLIPPETKSEPVEVAHAIPWMND